MTSSKGKSSSGKKRSTSSKSASSKKSSSKGYKVNTAPKRKRPQPKKEETYEFDYVKFLIIIGIFALFILMFLFSAGVFGGVFGDFIKHLNKGLLGVNAFVIPIAGIGLLIYMLFTETTKKTVFNLVSLILGVTSIGMIAHAICYDDINASKYTDMVKLFFHEQKGGGAIFGSVAYLIDACFGKAFVYIISILIIIAAIAVLFGKYIVRLSKYLYEKFVMLPDKREGGDDDDDDDEDEKYSKAEIRRMKEEEERKNKKPSNYKIDDVKEEPKKEEPKKADVIDVNPSEIKTIFDIDREEKERLKAEREAKETKDIHAIDPSKIKKSVTEDEIRPINSADRIDIEARDVVKEPALPEKIEPAEFSQPALTDSSKAMLEKTGEDIGKISIDPVLDTYKKEDKKPTKPYKFPPLELLKRGDRKNKNNSNDLLETANKLKDTLMTFGVEVTIDPANCSRGPSVTRYELTPAPGVKVAKIVSLQDDIKLSLGAADIRIEAPIPGKSAVGIEVPNSSSTAVPFGDLVASNEFKNADSKIAFTVGKDLSGDIVVSDIDKMPHLLIAGATGSGKSVCINTIIMSILYKAHPDDVKLIMIDPKVVELSVYNGIPHLLLPVVTDPKQASASLHWGVSEMEDRYKKFADFGVRDLKGYNEKIVSEGGNKLPQVVIIVDELADLMMVAGKEVEESICRLTQLARAAGIHLIIATQRPSVDVITGLIKANMPSRIAFAVSSGVDSRTILDTTGAEKLLGKGDMLFFPRGTNKPSRIQGCFVSDNEVLDVVDFIKNQNIKGYDERIIESVKSGNTGSSSFSGGSDIDDLFSEAGRFIIGKEKASIGALQRAFKIGFNRAARIMDQLEANGVVGGEEGTKPRKILMTLDEFEELVNKINN